MEKRIEEAGGRDAVQTKLDILNELRECTSSGRLIHAGVVGYQGTIKIDRKTGTQHGEDIVLLRSLLDEKDDLHILHCLSGVMISPRPISAQELKSLELPEGPDYYHIRGERGFPIETDAFWPWLYGQ